MSQPLGGVGWWDWQYELQKNNPSSDKLFTKDFQQLVRIQNILFQLIKMEHTDPDSLPFLKEAANQGSVILGFTARGKEHLSATFMQLKDNQFISENELLFKKYGLKLDNGKTSWAGHFNCPQFSREVIYQKGVMFLAGEDKGGALRCTLAHTKHNFKTIFFVDDSPKNTNSMDKAFSNQNQYQVFNILYTKEHAKEQQVQTNPNLQAQLFAQWREIQDSLKQVITYPNV